MPEIPEYVKFDFLITIIGLLLSGYTGQIIVEEQQNSNIILFFLLGIVILILGVNEMNKNYEKDKEIRALRYELEKLELNEKINKLKTEKE